MHVDSWSMKIISGGGRRVQRGELGSARVSAGGGGGGWAEIERVR